MFYTLQKINNNRKATDITSVALSFFIYGFPYFTLVTFNNSIPIPRNDRTFFTPTTIAFKNNFNQNYLSFILVCSKNEAHVVHILLDTPDNFQYVAHRQDSKSRLMDTLFLI